ncbi:MAG: hypothetical protein ABGY25_03065, partial [Acidimicrobiales bacterium]
MRIPTRTHLGIRGLVAVLLVASMACAGSPTSDGSPIPEVSAASDVLLDAACPGEEVPTDLSVTCHRLELGDASLSVVV